MSQPPQQFYPPEDHASKRLVTKWLGRSPKCPQRREEEKNSTLLKTMPQAAGKKRDKPKQLKSNYYLTTGFSERT